MELLSLAAAGIVAALCAVVVRQRAPEIAFVLAAAACLVLLWNTLPLLETIRDVLRELADLADLSPTILRPLLQTVGLALVTKLAAALCRDAGEGSVAGGSGAGGLTLIKNGPGAHHGAAVMRGLLLAVLAAFLLMPTALALDQTGDPLLNQEEVYQDQHQTLGMDELEEVGEAYTGQETVGEDLDVAASFRHITQLGKDALGGVVKSSVRSCVLLLAVTLLCGLAEGLKAGAGESGLSVTTLAAALAIAAIAVGDVHSLLALGQEAMDNMKSLGDVLLPAVSMATAASGTPAMAVVKHGATILFSDFLIRLINSLLIPLCYAFVAANVAWAALGNDGLKRLGGLIKWLITIVLSAVLLIFVGYLNLSGVISGGADAATVKAAKFTISNLVPVVGGVISDTAETLLAGASVLRNAAGVFGMLAVLGICVVPFLNLGAHYLLYRCTAALAATVSGDGRVTGLIEALGAAFGLILAMTASCAVLLVVAMVSAVSAVTG